MASERDGERVPFRIMLAYDWLMPVSALSDAMEGVFGMARVHHIL